VIVEESAVSGRYELLDFLLPTIPLRHLKIALLDRRHLDMHALSAHVRVIAKVVKIVTHWLFATCRAFDNVLGTAKYGHCWPDDALGSESCLHVPVRIFEVVRIG